MNNLFERWTFGPFEWALDLLSNGNNLIIRLLGFILMIPCFFWIFIGGGILSIIFIILHIIFGDIP